MEQAPKPRRNIKRIVVVVAVVIIAVAAVWFVIYVSAVKSSLSKLTQYNDELEKITANSTDKLDTALINSKYVENDLQLITKEELLSLSDDSGYRELLRTEAELLSKWEPAENFKSYPGITSDTILKFIRRCGAFDTAPSNALRVPAARGIKTLSIEHLLYNVDVPVAFHIIIDKQRQGLLADMRRKIDDQINVLNSVYATFNIRFRLVSIDTTVNDNWFNTAFSRGNPNALRQMTSRLSKNPDRTMNVFSLNSDVLGEATYPWYDVKGTSMDYVVIHYNTFPGAPDTFEDGKYNQGKSLVHEAGHFLGLYHTFEGGEFKCDSAPPHDGCGPGDYVDDTPGQRVCYFDGCDENADSCPTPGKDPVKNYMGYNPDPCMTEMTQGQGVRLLQSIFAFRRYLITNL